MRRRYIPKHSASRKMSTLGVVLIVGIVLGLFLISGIGDVLAKNVLMPLLGQEQVTPAPSGFQTSNVTFPRLQMYMVQLAAYDNAEDAAAFAITVIERGGSGYVYGDGKYHVFAAGYTEQAAAQSVVDKQTEKDFNPTVYTLISGTVTFQLTGEKEQAEALHTASTYYPALVKELAEESVQLDKFAVTASHVRVEYTRRVGEVEKIISSLENLLKTNPNHAVISQLLSLYRNAKMFMTNISLNTNKQGLDLYAEIKYNYTEMACAYCTFILNIS